MIPVISCKIAVILIVETTETFVTFVTIVHLQPRGKEHGTRPDHPPYRPDAPHIVPAPIRNRQSEIGNPVFRPFKLLTPSFSLPFVPHVKELPNNYHARAEL